MSEDYWHVLEDAEAERLENFYLEMMEKINAALIRGDTERLVSFLRRQPSLRPHQGSARYTPPRRRRRKRS